MSLRRSDLVWLEEVVYLLDVHCEETELASDQRKKFREQPHSVMSRQAIVIIQILDLDQMMRLDFGLNLRR